MKAVRWGPLSACAVVATILTSPALAQTPLVGTPPARRAADNCAPIGRTANGELVYSMKCDNLPAPQPGAQSAAPPQPAEPEKVRSGLFGLSYDRR